jgi:uncharacterized protein YkwD
MAQCSGMRRTPLAVAALAAALALPTAQSVAHASPAPDPQTKARHVKPRANSWEARVLKLTNARRKAHGVKPLKASPCADRLAESWTRHMARTQVLKHQSLDPFFNCRNVSSAGENIAYGFETPRALVSAWMHSAGHRANILNRDFHRIGVSGWRATNGQTYATQDFLG